MHNLRIEGRKIYLDGFEVEGVTGYELKDNVGEVPELTLRLTVQDVLVRPTPAAYVSGGLVRTDILAIVGEEETETIIPLSKLQGILETGNGEVTTVLKQILDTLQAANKGTVLKIEGADMGKAEIKAIDEMQRGTYSGSLSN